MIIISGTNRPGANTKKVAERVLALSKKNIEEKKLSFSVKLLDLANLKPDIFDTSSYGQKPQWFLDEFQKPITEAKGILVVSPEYNGGFPGVLKYFIDMLKFPESLNNIPIAFIGVAAGQFGALRPVVQLEMLFNYRNAHIFGKRVFIPQIGDAIQADGTLGAYESRVSEQVDGFVTFVSKLSVG